MNVEFRGVIHFCWLRRLSPQETLTEMTDAYRQDCPSLPMIYKWYKEFEHGRKNLNDLPRVGRPISQEIRNHIKRFIDNFPSSSARYIALMLDISRETVKKVLIEELHYKKLHFRWVPHDLNESQKLNRCEQSKELLSILESLSDDQLKKVVTCDESWFFLWYAEGCIWTRDGKRPDATKHSNFDPKIMIFTSFSKAGPVLVDDLPLKTSFTANYLSSIILPQLKSKIQNMKGVSKSIKIRLHMDNARPHNTQMTIKKMHSLNMLRLPQPAYSPDVSPNDFFLYGYVKEQLKGLHFTSREGLVSKVIEIIGNIDKSI